MTEKGPDRKNRGGAPKKAPHELRSERLECRLTVAQKARIEVIAADLGMTLTDYVYQRLTKTRICAPSPTDRILNSALVELNRIGVNLNQLTRAAHIGRIDEAKIAHLLDELYMLMRRIDDRAAR